MMPYTTFDSAYQWYEEVLEKTEPNTLKVHIHHGKDKLRTVEDLKKYDVCPPSSRSVIDVDGYTPVSRSSSRRIRPLLWIFPN